VNRHGEADDDVHECDFDELCEILYRTRSRSLSHTNTRFLPGTHLLSLSHTLALPLTHTRSHTHTLALSHSHTQVNRHGEADDDVHECDFDELCEILHMFLHIYGIDTYIYSYIQIYMHICIYLYVCQYIYIYMYIDVYIWMHVYISTYIHIFLCICIYKYIYTYMYMYIYIYISIWVLASSLFGDCTRWIGTGRRTTTCMNATSTSSARSSTALPPPR